MTIKITNHTPRPWIFPIASCCSLDKSPATTWAPPLSSSTSQLPLKAAYIYIYIYIYIYSTTSSATPTDINETFSPSYMPTLPPCMVCIE